MEATFTAVWTAVTGVLSAAVDMMGGIINGLLETFDGIITFVNGVFSGNWRQAWEGVKQIFNGIFDTIGSVCKGVMNSIVSVINGAINGINRIHVSIPDWVPEVGGKSFGVHIPTLPKLEVGTPSWVGGLALMHEKGGEIVDLPRGSRVYPHDESVRRAYNDGRRSGGVSVSIPKLADQIVIREDADIDRLTSALTNKLTVALANVG
jgi:phage-related protein